MKRRPEAPPEQIDAALELVRRRTGLIFSDPRRGAFESALAACMRRAGAGALPSYLRQLESNPDLFDELTAEITVGETYFLRDPAQWNLIRTRLLPSMLERHGDDRRLRIWSAGCASGEEPYSAALVLHQLGAAGRAQILGTDLSRPALERARRATYPRWALRNVPEDIERAYFRRVGARYELVSSLSRQVEFRHLNLASPGTVGGAGYGVGSMDLIICRNVLIYFDQPTVVEVVRRLLDSLSPTGWLVLGASDPLVGGSVPCEVEVTEAGLVYRRATGRAEWRPPAPALVPPAPRSLESVPPVHPPPRDGDVPAAVAPAAEEPDRLAEVRRLYAAKDYAGAVERARRSLLLGERDAGLEIVLIRSLANRGDLTGAGRACAEALDFHRASAELLYVHAVLLRHAGRPGEASDALRRALYLDRGFIVAHLALGEILARTGDSAGAGRAFRTAERLLADLPPESAVAGSDGETAARLAEAARMQLRLLGHTAA